MTPSTTELSIVLISINEIIPYEVNNKIHTSKSLRDLKESIQRFGMRKPIEVDEGNIILCGHGRYQACIALGMTEVPVIIHKDMTEEQKRKYRYVDNAVGFLSERNIGNIQEEFGNDFDDKWLIDILKKVNPEFKLNIEIDQSLKEDLVPDIKGNIVFKQGDLIEVGRHRILCGDSTLENDVKTLMQGQKADCVVTDPPYNVAYHGHAENTKEMIMNDKMDSNQFYHFLHDAFKNLITSQKVGGGAYIFHNHKEQINFQKALEDSGYTIKQQLIRNKPSLGMGAGTMSMNTYTQRKSQWHYMKKQSKIAQSKTT